MLHRTGRELDGFQNGITRRHPRTRVLANLSKNHHKTKQNTEGLLNEFTCNAVENKEDSRQLEPVIKQVKFYISNQVNKNVVFQALVKDNVPSNEITQNKTARKLINHISRF